MARRITRSATLAYWPVLANSPVQPAPALYGAPIAQSAQAARRRETTRATQSVEEPSQPAARPSHNRLPTRSAPIQAPFHDAPLARSLPLMRHRQPTRPPYQNRATRERFRAAEVTAQ